MTSTKSTRERVLSAVKEVFNFIKLKLFFIHVKDTVVKVNTLFAIGREIVR